MKRCAILPLLGLMLAQPGFAKTVCCTDAKGNMVCDEGMPAACHNRAYHELNSQGGISRSVEAPLTPAQQARRDKEQAKKRELEKRRQDQEKHDRQLLATYSSAHDIDIVRDRTLADQEKLQAQIEAKMNDLLRQKQQLANELEFYKKHAAPPTLKQNIANNEKQLRAEQTLLDNKKRDISNLRSRFENDKKRYLELGGQR